ncbi:DMT family transporter [Serratia ficaria]|uniref:DMT family transporter n=1 Tax=Serratia ficaria TaxID=61651 RepID=UPI00217C0AD8|nr:DMT family transporter [Serratia ficaria]MEE4481637.1 DMT family transporter [Serratia ficaria]CAI1002440.1 Uncharacterized protein conserved in bacteria [Serratia ficaria]CAI1685619.1 Uncharacterized protein conserved in bacteria [Serratia ficaria]CAI2420618.1 Uncharacterized protein conserved in bacteria [Serratia ficaria]CAI2492506.1 Uncharacterized protein conserved in bacteria [Serratia ficaria]
MSFLILLALFNGVCISISRAVNGRLALDRGAFSASLCNHIVGFLFLSLLLAASGGFSLDQTGQAPWGAYLGGAIGALFVALNSYVLPRLGAMRAALLIISGQMLAGVAIDSLNGGPPAMAPLFGVALILLGVYLARMKRSVGALLWKTVRPHR